MAENAPSSAAFGSGLPRCRRARPVAGTVSSVRVEPIEAELGGAARAVEEDRAPRPKAAEQIDLVQQRRVLHDQRVGLDDRLADADRPLVDAAERDDRGAGALGAEARERLRVAAVAERRDGQQLGGRHHALTAASVDADLEHRSPTLPGGGPPVRGGSPRRSAAKYGGCAGTLAPNGPARGARREPGARALRGGAHGGRPRAVRAERRAWPGAACVAHILVGELDGARRRGGRDAPLADRLRQGRRARRPLGRDRGRRGASSASPSASTTGCTATWGTVEAWGRTSARPTSGARHRTPRCCASGSARATSCCCTTRRRRGWCPTWSTPASR